MFRFLCSASLPCFVGQVLFNVQVSVQYVTPVFCGLGVVQCLGFCVVRHSRVLWGKCCSMFRFLCSASLPCFVRQVLCNVQVSVQYVTHVFCGVGVVQCLGFCVVRHSRVLWGRCCSMFRFLCSTSLPCFVGQVLFNVQVSVQYVTPVFCCVGVVQCLGFCVVRHSHVLWGRCCSMFRFLCSTSLPLFVGQVLFNVQVSVQYVTPVFCGVGVVQYLGFCVVRHSRVLWGRCCSMFRFLYSASLPCFVGQVLFNVQVSVQCVIPMFSGLGVVQCLGLCVVRHSRVLWGRCCSMFRFLCSTSLPCFVGQVLFNVQVSVQCVTHVFCGVGVVQYLGFCVVRHSRVLWGTCFSMFRFMCSASLPYFVVQVLFNVQVSVQCVIPVFCGVGVVQCLGFCVVRHSRVLWGKCCSMFRLLCSTSLPCFVGQALFYAQVAVQYVTPVFFGVGVVQCLGCCVVRHFRVLWGRCCSLFRFLCSTSLPCFVGQVLFIVQVSVQYVTPVFFGVGVVQCLGCCVVRHFRVLWGRCCSLFRFLCSTLLPCFVGQVLFNVQVSVQYVTPVFCGVGVVQCLGFCVVRHSRVLWGRCCSIFRFLCSTSLTCFVGQVLFNVQVSVQCVTPVFCGVGVVQCLGFCVVRHSRVLWGRCCSMLRFMCSASLPCFVGQVLFYVQVAVQYVTPVFCGVGVVQCLDFCVVRHSRVLWGRCCSMVRFLCSTSLPCFVGQVLFNVQVSVQYVTPVFCGVGVVQCLGFCVVRHFRCLWGRCCSMFRFLCSTSLPCFVGQVLFNIQVSVQYVTHVFCGVGVVQCLGFCVVSHSRVLWGRCCSMFRFLCSASLPCFVGQVLFNVQVYVQCVTPVFCGVGVVLCLGCCLVRHSRVLWGRCCSVFRFLCSTSLPCFVGQVLFNVQVSVEYVIPVFCGVGVVQCLGFCVVRHSRVLWGRCCSMFRFLCSASLPCFVGQALFYVQVAVQYVTPVFFGVGVVQCLGCCVVRHFRVLWGRCCSLFRFLCSTLLPCFVGQVLFNVQASVQYVTPVFCGVGVVQCLGFCVVRHSRILWGRCCSMFRFLCSTLQIVVCLFLLFHCIVYPSIYRFQLLGILTNCPDRQIYELVVHCLITLSSN